MEVLNWNSGRESETRALGLDSDSSSALQQQALQGLSECNYQAVARF